MRLANGYLWGSKDKNKERRMTTALALIGLPASKGYIQKVEELIVNEEMIAKFSAYLDVSKVSLINYLYGLRAFLIAG
jgi:hypothetical protein